VDNSWRFDIDAARATAARRQLKAFFEGISLSDLMSEHSDVRTKWSRVMEGLERETGSRIRAVFGKHRMGSWKTNGIQAWFVERG
jgi:hypothetical protein